MILDRDPSRSGEEVAPEWAALAQQLVASREPGDVWLRTLALNMLSLREHRPEIYALLQTVEIVAEHTTLPECEEARVASAFVEIEPLRRAGHAIAIAGIGDGTLLRALAKFAPPLPLGRQQEVNLLEPDLSRLVEALGTVDFTGPRGPIAQPRFAWYVGEAWERWLCDDLLAQTTKMMPQRTLAGGLAREEITDGLWRVNERVRERQEEQRREIGDYYAALDDAELASLFSGSPPRKPRVLLLTSKFTTVLQYSTNDSADAFRELGWETRTETEGEPWHVMSRPAIRAAMAEFKPDLVFQIDHLRYELGDEIPAQCPFICWIQDHLANLSSTAAGESISARDFVLTGGVYRYASRYGYPRRQCVDMPKVARPPVLPTSWRHDREDLLYVSHWSSSPQQIIVDTCRHMNELRGGIAEGLMRSCTDELSVVYANGGAMRSDMEIRGLVRGVFASARQTLEADTEREFVDILFQRLNNALYRQQSLLWAARIADEQGLKFGIYGQGWEKHPELGRFARGIVKYGPNLEALTRQSKILLQLEPYACYTHQRMLDCVLAGGFALIRDHILNTLPIRIRKFLDAHVPGDVNDLPTARSRLDAGKTQAFDELLVESQVITDLGDPVEVVRGWQRAGTLGNGDETLPHLNVINFDSYEGLRERVLTYIGDRDARARISADQRASVLGRLTYASALGRALSVTHQRLEESINVSDAPSLPTPAEAA